MAAEPTTKRATGGDDQSTKPYHHRNLPAALRSAAADLVSERGPAGFSLREVARRAGVSHAAPAHHFGDTRGLLTSLAAEGFERLASALADASKEPDPTRRLRNCGRAYVSTALEYPGHFAVIFQDDLLDQDSAELQQHGTAAMVHLVETVEALRDELNPDLDVDNAATMCWATMQGLVSLAPTLDHITDGNRPTIDVVIDGLCTIMLDGLRPR
ncbi:MAG: TetR/AcrR family transcriptional regulator [Ilumatobacter sp.]